MQSRDAHEVRDAGAVEELPLFRRNGALVADRERRENSGRRRRAEHAQEAIPNRLARCFYQVEEVVARAEPPLLAALADVAGGADAALEEPGLVIEAVRVDVAVRAAQAHREQPALAGMHRAGEDRGRVLVQRTAVPREQNLAGKIRGQTCGGAV